LQNRCSSRRCRTTQNLIPSRIKGLVFDLDGTLIHSTIDFFQMRRQTFERMRDAGIPEDMLDGTKSIAENLQVSFRYLEVRDSFEAARSLCTDAGMIMNEIEMFKVGQTKAVTGTKETVRQLIENGYPIALLTRGSRRYTEAALSASGLADYFPHTVCRDDHPDEEAKPNPIAMARAAGLMDLDKEECLLVGDHQMDLECARSAGSIFVGVLSGATDWAAWTRLGDVTVITDVSWLPSLLTRK
jgi:phosphoglycolate phosphatase